MGAGESRGARPHPVLAHFAWNPIGPSLTPLVQSTRGGYARFLVQIPIHLQPGTTLAFHLLNLSDFTLSNANVIRF